MSKKRYWKNICQIQKEQTAKGKEKYGMILEDNTEVSLPDRVRYFQEELIDGLMYSEWMVEKLTEQDKEVQDLRRENEEQKVLIRQLKSELIIQKQENERLRARALNANLSE